MTLEQELHAWDGRSKDAILRIYKRHCSEARVSDVVSYLRNIDCRKGASWLLKHHLESGGILLEQEQSDVLASLDVPLDWETKLHLLQCLPYLTIPKRYKNELYDLLCLCVSDSNKFIRAWSYNGLSVVATQYPEFSDVVRRQLSTAMTDEAASVKARLRRIFASGF